MSGVPDTARAARALAETWLAHLARDARGFPIPWINRWGEETAAATRVAYDPVIGRHAIFHDDHGPVPDFTRQNMGRQRKSMIEGLCQVCGRFTPWSRRNLIAAPATTENIRVDELGGRMMGAISEPWLDDRCAAIATLLCPALIRRRHDDTITLMPIHRAKDVVLSVSTGRLDVAGLADAADDPAEVARVRAEIGGLGQVAMWVKAIPLTLRLDVREAATADA